MHRIYHLGSLASSNRSTQRSSMRFIAPNDKLGTKIVLVTFVAPTGFGPRIEEMDKFPAEPRRNSIPVHGVDHRYLDGFVVDRDNHDYDSVGQPARSGHIIPLVTRTYRTASDYSGFPTSFTAGDWMFALASVEMKSAKDGWDCRIVFNVKGNQYKPPMPVTIVTFQFEMNWFVPKLLDILAPDARTMRLISFTQLAASSSFIRTASYFGSIPPILPDYSGLIRYWIIEENIRLKKIQIDPYLLASLTVSAIEDAKFTDVLSLENAVQYPAMLETLTEFRDMGMDVVKFIKKKNPLYILRFLASAHLCYRYVLKTTWKDIGDIKKFAKLLWKNRAMWWNYLSHTTGRCNPERSIVASLGYDYESVINLSVDLSCAQFQFMDYLCTVGLAPGLVDIWDLIPFSFAVDWVLPVGDTINAFDLISDLENIDTLFIYSIRSNRLVRLNIDSKYDFVGSSNLYRRIVSRSYPGASCTAFKLKNPFKNAWTALALVISALTGRKK